MANYRLLTKIREDFLFGFYLLNYVLNHATNHIQTRCKQAEKPAAQTAHLVLPTRKPTLKKPKELFFANARTNEE